MSTSDTMNLEHRFYRAVPHNFPLRMHQNIPEYLLADFYISVAKCYLDFDGEFSAEDFVEHVVLFANRNFFE